MKVTQKARHPKSDRRSKKDKHTKDANPPSFETVWAALQETDRMIKALKESQKEYEQERKKDKAEFNERLGNYINLFGDFTEYVMAPKLCEKFNELGFDFSTSIRNTRVRDKTNNIFFETDAVLENYDKAMIVEIKTELTVERINKHIERLEKMRRYADLHGDKRTFLGAVAGVVVDDEARDYALNQGLFLIEPAGEELNITPPNGHPKEW